MRGIFSTNLYDDWRGGGGCGQLESTTLPSGNAIRNVERFASYFVLPTSGLTRQSEIYLFYAGIEVLAAVAIKSSVLRDMMPCSPLNINRRFGGTCHLPLQGRRIIQARNP
jgi:hypothetical protein